MLTLTSHPIIPQMTCCSRCNVANPDHKISEMLSGFTFKSIPFNHRFQECQDLGLGDGFCELYQIDV